MPLLQDQSRYFCAQSSKEIQYWGIKLELNRTALLPVDLEDSYITTNIDGFEIKTSIPERAVLEMLYYIPVKQGFDEALISFQCRLSFIRKFYQ